MTLCNIKISGINDGKYLYTFHVNKNFFKQYIHSEIKHGNITAKFLLEKKNQSLSLNIQLTGEIDHLQCDICTEDLSVDISFKTRMIITITSEKRMSTDDIIYVSPNQKEINLDHLLFELITLAVPNRRRHHKTKCNTEMIDLIELYSNNKKTSSDPRWSTLKNIKLNK